MTCVCGAAVDSDECQRRAHLRGAREVTSRVVRVPDDLWTRALARADEKGEHLSEAIRRFLERYTR